MKKLFFLILFVSSFLLTPYASAASDPQQPIAKKPLQVAGYYGERCRWVGGYWRNGFWHPARKICSNRHYRRGGRNCYWVGYWRYGKWHPTRKVCRHRY